MGNTVIRVEGLSKMYHLGIIGYGTLKDDLQSAWARFRGKEDPNAKIGKESRFGQKGDFWALKDINFDVQQGDRIGIVGRNGAGKSTLLKVLSRVTAPTSGSIKVKGRIASLLEVGTGFHPELTGRENVFLNGAILGMKRREIQQKFDEIVNFAGVGEFIDTPVKRYSSGMYVRLAFSVAAHLDSDILIIDEVLAVGDAEFQKKCLGKLDSVSKDEGRTILFVSHSTETVQKLCNSALFLEEGQAKYPLGNVETILNKYTKTENNTNSWMWNKKDNREYFNLEELYLTDKEGARIDSVASSKIAYLVIEGEFTNFEQGFHLGYALFSNTKELLYWSANTDTDKPFEKSDIGKKIIKTKLPIEVLNEGQYTIRFFSAIHNSRWIIEPNPEAPSLVFNVFLSNTGTSYWNGIRPGVLAPRLEWKVE